MLLSVVNDILDFSRLEAGAVAIAAAPFDLGPFVQDTVEIVRPLAEQKGLRLGFGRVEELRLLGDPARLRQMLLNLLGNAVKFTDAGGVELTTTVSRRADDVTLRLEVRDTGMGIAPDQVTRLFDRFSQVDGSNSRRHGGTGLGLSITKRLCDLMGGRMGVDSRPGAGSTFWFEIDLPIAEAAAPEASRSLGGGLSAAVRVLLAEDHKMNQVLARTLLEGLGCEVDVVENGAEALAAVQRASYDLVLMDMQMPVMDGLQAARAIRELGSDFRSPPIVAMTANVLPEHVALCRQAGMCDHVAKPIDLDELVAVLSRWLPARPEARAAA
jgi:CheY-like chemotaxis protein